jgi:1-deoxy-D-xylulose-5-phosphate synthase
VEIQQEMTALPLGKAEIRRKGKSLAILAFGTMVEPCERIAEELDATVVNMRFVKPIDEMLIVEMCADHDLIVTVEENVIPGGAGAAVNEVIAAHGVTQKIANYGLPDRLLQHGSREDMLRDAGLDYEGIRNFIISQSDQFEKERKISSAS